MEIIVSICGCMFFIGFLANGLLGLKFVFGPGGKTNPFLYGLLIADVLVCCLSGPSTVIVYTVTTISPDWLQFAIFMQALPVSASNLSMMALSINRYLTLKNFKPTEDENKRRLLFASGIVIIWVTAAILASIQLVKRDQLKRTFNLSNMVIGYLIPVCVVLSCYLMLHVKLTTLSIRARASCGEVPLPVPMFRQRNNLIIISGLPQEQRKQRKTELVQVEEDISQMRRTTLLNRKRLANSLLFMAIAFSICWLPYIICQFCEEFNVTTLITQEYTLILGLFHSTLNPMIYWSYNRKWPKLTLKFNFPQFSGHSPSSTNEANLGPFNPLLIRPRLREPSINEIVQGEYCPDLENNSYPPIELNAIPVNPTRDKFKDSKPKLKRTRSAKTKSERSKSSRPKFVKSRSSDYLY